MILLHWLDSNTFAEHTANQAREDVHDQHTSLT